ncbi:sensor histidine kinase [Fusibacter tunisiensis]|uniref:histidine kinase n=1 Tax=Fusibacter tunisiensis TaxID=1008308 RepID=A0ABS2MSQ7_9FIRM|nr:sensor histidine kinase [Fusibacter tunisiensis]MBM7562400.1 two-component system sensor histidine kinase DegS [Fusibacter tunisiensis]
MMEKFSSTKVLDQIVNKTALAIEEGKKEIFGISESVRRENATLESELVMTKAKLSIIISDVDKLEIRTQMAKNMIKTINEHFDEFGEKDIREAYELSESVQLLLSSKRHEERELVEKRNTLERMLRNNNEMLKKAEVLEMKVSVALEYLTGNVVEQIKEKKDIGLKIIEAQEQEKKRISRDIHDGPAQSLANVIYKAEYASKVIDHAPGKAKKEIYDLQEDVRNILNDIRRIIYDLMPMSLDDLGLVPTVKKLAMNINDSYKVKVHLNTVQESVVEDSLVNLMAFRVIQESLNNIVKHSKSKTATIDLQILDDFLKVDIWDEGKGFNVEEIEHNPSGYGLYNMKERVEIVNGDISIESSPKKGTHIKLRIPNQ